MRKTEKETDINYAFLHGFNEYYLRQRERGKKSYKM